MRLRTRYTQRFPTAPGLRLDIPMFGGSGTKVLDLSGYGNHGTIHDAVWTRDEKGVAMLFNGTSAYIDCGNDESLEISSAFTIEAWVNIADKTDPRPVICKRNAVVIQPFLLTHDASDGWTFAASEDGTTWGTLIQTSQFADINKWYYVVATHDGSITKLYENAIEIGSDTTPANIQTGTGYNVLIGTRGEQKFNGTIDEVRIYNRALSAEEIERRYEQTNRDYIRAS